MKKTFKVLLLTLLVMMLMFTVCGCSYASDTSSDNEENTETSEPAKLNFGFEYIDRDGDFTLYREKSTDVMYIYAYDDFSYGAAAGLTVMSDPETGLPLTYSKWVENYQNK